jgi:fructose-specific phosphotransferase system IIC component
MKELVDIFKHLRTHLMNGVSYMIPVVVGGGILMAIAVLITGEGASPVWGDGIPYWLWTIGSDALGLMVPVLSAYIAYSIADRPGIAPGLAGGIMALNIPVSADETASAGFIGGIVTGILAGIFAQYLKKIPLPKSMQSLKSIIIIPVVSILLIGIIMFGIIGGPIATFMDWMETLLQGATDGNIMLISALAGLMIAFDLGGPVNKVAYSILMVAFVGDGIYQFAAPVGIAICIPPIGVGVASLILKKKFSKEERNAGVGAIAMGFCGITEGAISYTTADPLRMIPINMISSAIAAGLAGLLGVGKTSAAAWGGLIVTPVISSPLLYVLCILVGVVIYVALCAVIKKDYVEKEEEIGDVDISFE